MPKEPPPDSQGLPRWLRLTIVLTCLAAMVAHIAYDAAASAYEGASISLMLGGIVGSALGLNEYLRNRGGGG